jgi:hypothetical protein
VKRRWEAWWEQEIYDRPVICITAPLAVPRPDIPRQGELDVDPRTRWTDSRYMICRTLESLRTTFFGGEAIPWCWNPISAGHALYFGCNPHFASDTMWVDPAPVGEGGYPLLDGWRESSWWHLARAQIENFSEASRGRFFVLPFWGNHAGDILAAVRGPERFYLDFAMDPGWVASALKKMSDILVEVHGQLWKRAFGKVAGTEGTLNYNGCWSSAHTMSFDCDISCNISSRDFREMVLPLLLASMQIVDRRIYHLDGPGALHHLDALLAVRELHAIQWVPGAGNEAIMQWIPLIQRIQKSGKSVQVTCEPEEVAPLIRKVSRKGLCIWTRCGTESKARELLRLVSRL